MDHARAAAPTEHSQSGAFSADSDSSSNVKGEPALARPCPRLGGEAGKHSKHAGKHPSSASGLPAWQRTAQRLPPGDIPTQDEMFRAAGPNRIPFEAGRADGIAEAYRARSTRTALA